MNMFGHFVHGGSASSTELSLIHIYTPSAVTEALTDVLKEHHIIPEKVLEPSAGIGAFVDSVLDNNPKAGIMAVSYTHLTYYQGRQESALLRYSAS